VFVVIKYKIHLHSETKGHWYVWQFRFHLIIELHQKRVTPFFLAALRCSCFCFVVWFLFQRNVVQHAWFSTWTWLPSCWNAKGDRQLWSRPRKGEGSPQRRMWLCCSFPRMPSHPSVQSDTPAFWIVLYTERQMQLSKLIKSKIHFTAKRQGMTPASRETVSENIFYFRIESNARLIRCVHQTSFNKHATTERFIFVNSLSCCWVLHTTHLVANHCQNFIAMSTHSLT